MNPASTPPALPQTSSPGAVVTARRRIWPYVVSFAVISAAGSVWWWYRFLTTPVPLSVDDSSSPIGNLFVLVVVVFTTIACTLVGAMLGAMIGWLARVRPVVVVGLALGIVAHVGVFGALWFSTSHQLLMLELREDAMHQILHEGRMMEVEHEVRAILAAKTRLLGPEYGTTLLSRDDLIYILERQGKTDEAEGELRKLIATRERTLGFGNAATLWNRELLVSYLEKKGDYAGAETELRALLNYDESACGPEHDRTQKDRGALARCFRNQKKYAEEEVQLRFRLKHDELYDRSREKVERCYTSVQIARCLRNQGRVEEAKLFAKQAIDGWLNSKWGGDHYKSEISSLWVEMQLDKD